MDTYTCNVCEIEKNLEDFYYNEKFKTRRVYTCRECINEKEKQRYRKKFEQKGGSFSIPTLPHVFRCEIQKKGVFDLLMRIGWQVNPDGTWWKDGIKTQDGKWLKMRANSKSNRKNRNLLRKIFKENITPDKLPKIEIEYNLKHSRFTSETINYCIYEFFINKRTVKSISEEQNIPQSNIQYYITKIYEKMED